MNYEQFIDAKRFNDPSTGIEPSSISDKLFPFQADIVRWALRRGRAAIFADCGMGKTAMQLEWARQVPGRVLIADPERLHRMRKELIEVAAVAVAMVESLDRNELKTQNT